MLTISSLYNIFFGSKEVFSAYNYFIKNEKPLSPVPSSLLPSTYIPEVGMWAKPLQIEYKNILEVLTIVPFLFSLLS